MKITITALAFTLAAAGSAAAAAEVRAVLPVAGSTAGAFNSHFKTELQMNNRSAQPMSGTLLFWPAGGAAEPLRLPYSIAPHQTMYWPDIVDAFHTTGLGSIDVEAEGHGVPSIIARAFDDQGEQGTTGTTVPPVFADGILGPGSVASLILPGDRARFRFNIGIRTFGEGATIRIAVYGENGILRRTLEQHIIPNMFWQQAADAVAGETLLSNDSLVFEITSGSAIIYGAMTDNVTNDPSLQLAVAGGGNE